MSLKEINKKYFDFLSEDYREHVIYGGSAAGKSAAILQFLLYNFLTAEEPTRILIARKWFAALRYTVLVDLKAVLDEWDVWKKIDYNRSANYLICGDNRIDLMGIDNAEKIKGANYTYIWLEETTDFLVEDYRQLKLRLGRSKANSNAKFIFSFNPIDPEHFTWQDLVCREKPNRHVLHSTFLDNVDNLNPEWVEELLKLKDEDPNYYNVYVLGLPGAIGNTIYTNYDIKPITDVQFNAAKFDAIGVDFGFNNPTAVCGILETSAGFKVVELVYKRHITNGDLIAILDRNKVMWGVKGTPMYCDAAEPNRIEELRRAGFDARPANKDVKLGLDFCKRHKIICGAGSSNLIREIKGYKYREDRNGKVFDEPLKYNDHLMDAMRYGIFTHFGRGKSPKVSFMSGGYSKEIDIL